MTFSANKILLALLLATMTACFAAPAASADTKYHVGDHIEAYDVYTSDWQTGVIFLVEDYTSTGQGVSYKARIDGGPPKGSSQDELLLREDQIRPITAFAGQFKLGSTVDTAYGSGDPNSRGQVIAVDPAGKRYQVHYPGCNAKRNEWLDQSQVKVPEKMSAVATRFLAGKWIMFTPSYPNTVIHDSQIFREYGTGARTPPLVIKSNRTFVWYYDFGKKPVKGRWTPDSRVKGTTTGTQSVDGVIILDPQSNPWKVYKRVVKGDSKAHITVERMCWGLTDIGTRAG
jgi:hypothetical protein